MQERCTASIRLQHVGMCLPVWAIDGLAGGAHLAQTSGVRSALSVTGMQAAIVRPWGDASLPA
eukprot:7407001-Alexandrium_andersonii.AAC.1